MKITTYKNLNGFCLTVIVNMFGIENFEFENSDRGILFWFVTDKMVRVIGKGNRPAFRERFVHRSWTNTGETCG